MWESLAPTLVALPVLGAVAVVAAFVGSVTGGGVTVIFLPVLVFYFGIREAVPIGTLSLVTATISRVVVYRQSVDPPTATWFNVGSLPGTVAGTYLFTVAAPGILTRVFGVALLGAVLWRRLHPNPPVKFARPWFVPLGAAYGFLSGVSVTVASMPAPFFLAYGLRKEAFVGTMGLSVLLGQVAKLGVFKSADLLTPTVLLHGIARSVHGHRHRAREARARQDSRVPVPVRHRCHDRPVRADIHRQGGEIAARRALGHDDHTGVDASE